ALTPRSCLLRIVTHFVQHSFLENTQSSKLPEDSESSESSPSESSSLFSSSFSFSSSSPSNGPSGDGASGLLSNIKIIFAIINLLQPGWIVSISFHLVSNLLNRYSHTNKLKV